jgi:hypothetical protein
MTTPLPVSGTLITLTDANTVAGNFGQTVTAQGIALAELVISLRTGIELSDPSIVDGMEDSDRYWLAQAAVFQAIWAKGQPDLLTRIDQAQSTTDGDQITVNPEGLTIAPLAKWALLKTSYLAWNTAEAEPVLPARPFDPESIGWKRWHT